MKRWKEEKSQKERGKQKNWHSKWILEKSDSYLFQIRVSKNQLRSVNDLLFLWKYVYNLLYFNL